MIEVLLEILIFSLIFLLGFDFYTSSSVRLARIKEDMDEFIDMVMGIDFIRDEVMTRIRSSGFSASSTTFLSFEGFSNGRVRTITYRIVEKGGEYRIYRHADGEGNNIVLRSEKIVRFEPKNGMVVIHVGEYSFYLYEPDGITPRPSKPPEGS